MLIFVFRICLSYFCLFLFPIKNHFAKKVLVRGMVVNAVRILFPSLHFSHLVNVCQIVNIVLANSPSGLLPVCRYLLNLFRILGENLLGDFI